MGFHGVHSSTRHRRLCWQDVLFGAGYVLLLVPKAAGPSGRRNRFVLQPMVKQMTLLKAKIRVTEMLER